MSFEINKIIAAVLVAAIVAMVSGILADSLVRPQMLTKNVYQIAGTAPTESKEAAAPAAPEPIGPLLASASVDEGKKVSAKCASCHTFEKGGPNRVGPNLYDVVNEPIAEGHGGFAFSDALKAHKGNWTPDLLNEWLTNPQAFAKGTKMTFAGLPKAKDRANIIAYLNSLSDNPKPLVSSTPAAAPAPAAENKGAAPAAAPAPQNKGGADNAAPGNATGGTAGSGGGSGGAGEPNANKGGANGEVGK